MRKLTRDIKQFVFDYIIKKKQSQNPILRAGVWTTLLFLLSKKEELNLSIVLLAFLVIVPKQQQKKKKSLSDLALCAHSGESTHYPCCLTWSL